MDLGSLDFGTWRLVGLGLLSLGALATVVAIVAIIAMFRAGSVDYGRVVTAAPRNEEDFDDEDDDVDDADDEDRDDEDRDDDPGTLDGSREEVTAAARTAGGPTSLPFELSSPREDPFGVSANAAPRQTIQSTRDEPHVPSPDWYDYADVAEAKPAAEQGDDAANTALVAIPKEDPPSTLPASSPPPGTGPQQVVDPIGRETIRRSRWFDDAAAADEASPAVSEFRPGAPSAATAATPVTFPWEQRAEPKSTTPERPVAPVRDEPVRPTADRQDPRRPLPAEFEPTATSLPSEQRPTAPTPPERREPQRPAAGPEDTGRAAAVPSATPAKAAERQDPDAPTADWYDDPDGSGGERWWDGKGWTRHRRRRGGSSPTTDTGRQRAVSAEPDADPPAAAIRRRDAPADADDARGGQTTSRPPGWYRDPTGAGGRRFWDGSRWTDGS